MDFEEPLQKDMAFLAEKGLDGHALLQPALQIQIQIQIQIQMMNLIFFFTSDNILGTPRSRIIIYP
jgi:hypothetical protein